MIDVGWVAVIVAFSVGALIGMLVTALAVSVQPPYRLTEAYRQGQAECPRVHQWEGKRNTG